MPRFPFCLFRLLEVDFPLPNLGRDWEWGVGKQGPAFRRMGDRGRCRGLPGRRHRIVHEKLNSYKL